MKNTIELTNRLLINNLATILGRDLTPLDYTFSLENKETVTGFGTISEYLPVLNKNIVPKIYILEYGDPTNRELGLYFFGYSPEGFCENTTEFYYQNYGNLLYPQNTSIAAVLNNTADLHTTITIHDNGKDLVCEKTIEANSPTSYGSRSVNIYRSTDIDDDRVIIVLQESDLEDEEYFMNFLEGEEIELIDIKYLDNSSISD
jgi:hypothetical protein